MMKNQSVYVQGRDLALMSEEEMMDLLLSDAYNNKGVLYQLMKDMRLAIKSAESGKKYYKDKLEEEEKKSKKVVKKLKKVIEDMEEEDEEW